MISKSDIKYVSALQIKKFRQKYGQFIVEGEKCIAELLISSYNIKKIFATSEWIATNNGLLRNISCIETIQEELKKISHHPTPPQAIAIVEIKENVEFPSLKNKISIALETIQDPGNLGTIIRIADWYGIENILCSQDCTDWMGPKTLSATMGSFTRVNIHYCDLQETISKASVPSFACVLGGSSVYDIQKKDEGMIMIGNEGKGLSESLINAADFRISIPRPGKAESLNAGIAAAVICDNFFRS
ncbi:MAG: RNA methyltransferase [Bacteroidia bacterium]|nr:RNA methyltransferase [Bacteroidia bacterium]